MARAPSRAHLTAWGLTWLAYATYYTGRKGFSVTKRTIEQELGVTRDALAFIDTAFLVAYAFGQFANGLLGDSLGARRLVGYGMLLSAAACVSFGSASSAVGLGVCFLVNGYAQSTGWPGTTRAVAEWTTLHDRGTVMAFWATCYQVGGLAATAVATYLLTRYGWRSAYFVPAVLIAFVGLLVLGFLRTGPGASPEGSDASSTEPGLDAVGAREALARAQREARRRVLASPVLWSYGASYFSIKLIRYSLLFWLPYYLSEGLGYRDDQAGYMSIAFEVGGILGVVIIGVVSDRIRRYARASLAAGALVCLAVTLLFCNSAAHAGMAANVLVFAFVGAFLFGPDSLVSGAAAQDAGGRYAAATATGFVNGMGSLGAILQSFVTVEVSKRWGWGALFYVFVGLALLAAVCLLPSLGQRTTPTGSTT
jgi:sugar phosphate permease